MYDNKQQTQTVEINSNLKATSVPRDPASNNTIVLVKFETVF